MSNTQGLTVADSRTMHLVGAGDVMGRLAALPLSLMEDVRMGWPTASLRTAGAGGTVGALDCASGSGECGIGTGCAGGSGCCGSGGDCSGR